MKKKAIVSACLLGVECRYDGGSNKLPDEKLRELKEKYELIPVCPERYGGLTTPRIPSERVADKVRIQYGGSMKPSNVDGLMKQPEIDGGLIGGASLKAEDFARIVNYQE